MRQINPTGKSLTIYVNRVKPQNQKYFCLPEGKTEVCVWPSRPGQKGVGRRHGRWAGCDGRLFTLRRRRGSSVRQNRVVLAPVAGVKLSEKRKRERQRRSQPRTRLRGDHGISRKAIAQGRPGVLRCPVCSCAAFLVLTAHGTAGAARTRSSLRPLISRARKFLAKLGRICAARMQDCVWVTVQQQTPLSSRP
ncbi:hypothetical protein ABIE49_001403 [Bradyrhizobium sp. OAE829]